MILMCFWFSSNETSVLVCSMFPAPVWSQRMPRTGNCSADVTGVGDSGDVVELYVVHYDCHSSLLATHFTDPGSTLGSTWCMVFTEHHHGLDLVIQVLQVSSHSVVSNSYSSFYWRRGFYFSHRTWFIHPM